jgi:hypothetical protein
MRESHWKGVATLWATKVPTATVAITQISRNRASTRMRLKKLAISL